MFLIIDQKSEILCNDKNQAFRVAAGSSNRLKNELLLLRWSFIGYSITHIKALNNRNTSRKKYKMK